MSDETKLWLFLLGLLAIVAAVIGIVFYFGRRAANRKGAYFLTVPLQTHVHGLIVVQRERDAEGFKELLTRSEVFDQRLIAIHTETYAQGKFAGCFMTTTVDKPWLISVIGKTIEEVRSTGLHEIVHLADQAATNEENRARLVQHVYKVFEEDLKRRML